MLDILSDVVDIFRNDFKHSISVIFKGIPGLIGAPGLRGQKGEPGMYEI